MPAASRIEVNSAWRRRSSPFQNAQKGSSLGSPGSAEGAGASRAALGSYCGTRGTSQSAQTVKPGRYSARHCGQIIVCSAAFDGQSHSVAAAEAEGRDAALEVAALQFIKQCDQDARAARTDGMAEGDRAAVHIHLFGIQLELPCDRDGGHRKRFVQFD